VFILAIPENLTVALLLEEVNKAIYTVLVGGQSYKIGSREMTRANLAELKKMRADLEAQIGSGEAGNLMPGVYVAVFDGR
jgi:hypothetical protein